MSIKEEFAVERIVDKRLYNGVLQYKVKWVGYPVQDSTWEPAENLMKVTEQIAAFEEARGCLKAVCGPSPEEVKDQQQPQSQHSSTGDSTYKDYGIVRPVSVQPKQRSRVGARKRLKAEPTPSLTFDIPKRIIGLKKRETGVEAEIEWEPRSNGELLGISSHPISALRKHKHLARMLIEFYESIIE